MRSIRAEFLSALSVVLLLSAAASADASSSTSYRLEYQSINAAGGRSTSTSFALTDCLGSQPEAPGRSSSASFILYAGCAAAMPIGLPDDDDDGDGVTNGIEAAAPNGGDGNGDNIADQTQGNVASLPEAEGAGYLTLEACADVACMTACQAQQVTAVAESELPQQSELAFPFGLLGFVLECSTANVRVFYHAVDELAPNVVYEKFGPNPPGSGSSIFYALPGVVFGSQAVGSDPAVATARFVLTDGAVGDATGVDGSIVDPGGPAFEIVRTAPPLDPRGLAIAVIVLLLTAFVARRRRIDVAPREGSGGVRS